MSTTELEYFRQRAREERERAETAPTPIVAEVHVALAEKYEAYIAHPERRAMLTGLWSNREQPTAVSLEPIPPSPEHAASPG
jgi:hypothetical protein